MKVVLRGQEIVQYVQRFRDAGWPLPWWHYHIPAWPKEKNDILPHITFTLVGDWARMYKANIHVGGPQ